MKRFALLLLPCVCSSLRPIGLSRRCAAPIASAEPSATERASKVEDLKKTLSTAIALENYEEAARLRDELTQLTLDDEVAVLQANSAFYEAFTMRDLPAMSALWKEGEGATCVHPGSPHLYGHVDIIESWKEIFASSQMMIRPENVRCSVLAGGLSAVVTLSECVGKVGDDNALTATNVFEKGSDGWKMVLHMAGPTMQAVSVQGDESM